MAAPSASGPAPPPPLLRVLAECGRSRARAGELRLPHGPVPCPVFMPVGTRGTAKGLTAAQLAALGCRICLGNTYHLGTQPGPEVVQRAGGLHGFMDWPHNLLTRGLPDGVAGAAVGGDGGGGPLPLPLRRGGDPAQPREVHGDPERAGRRHRDAAGRRGEQQHDGAARGGGHGEVGALAGPLHRRQPPPAAAEPVRHRAGGAGPRPAHAVPARDDGAGRPRLRHRRPERRRGEGPLLEDGEAQHRPPPAGQTPLPHGRGLRHRPGGLRGAGLRHVRLRLPHAHGAFRLGAGALGLPAAEEQTFRQRLPPHRRELRLPHLPAAQPRLPARPAAQRAGRPAPPHRAQRRLPAQPDGLHPREHPGAALPGIRPQVPGHHVRGAGEGPRLGPGGFGRRRHRPGLTGTPPNPGGGRRRGPPPRERFYPFHAYFVFFIYFFYYYFFFKPQP